MTTTRMPLSQCPRCGQDLTAASHALGEDVKPEPNDPTVCINCATVLRFTDDMSLVVYEDSGLRALHRETRDQIARVQRAILMLKREREAKKEEK